MEFEINSKKYGIKKVLIDDEDWDRIKDYKWSPCLKPNGHNFYIFTNIYKKENYYSISLHRLIMDPPKNKVVDHINHDTLDNRKENLRICSQQENIRNMLSTRGKSPYKGVSFLKVKGKNKFNIYIRAQIKFDGKNKLLGHFKTEKEAALAYNDAAVKYFGEFACLNVID